MKARLCRCLVALVLTVGPAGAVSAQSSAPTPDPAPHSRPVTDPALVAQHYRQVLARPEFQESGEEVVDNQLEDWLSQWFKRLGEQIGSFTYASQMPAFESMLMTVLVTMSIAALIYIAVRLTRRRATMEVEPEDTPAGPRSFRPPEAYDAEIAHAIRTGDWRTAWLASWRQFLSRLERGHLVEADRTRTNREYLAQLRGKSLPAPAVALLVAMVDAYDRFIYGRTSIARGDWDLFHQHIDQAALLLHLDEKRAALKGEAA